MESLMTLAQGTGKNMQFIFVFQISQPEPAYIIHIGTFANATASCEFFLEEDVYDEFACL